MYLKIQEFLKCSIDSQSLRFSSLMFTASLPDLAYFTSSSSHSPGGGNLKICTNQNTLNLLEKKCREEGSKE